MADLSALRTSNNEYGPNQSRKLLLSADVAYSMNRHSTADEYECVTLKTNLWSETPLYRMQPVCDTSLQSCATFTGIANAVSRLKMYKLREFIGELNRFTSHAFKYFVYERRIFTRSLTTLQPTSIGSIGLLFERTLTASSVPLSALLTLEVFLLRNFSASRKSRSLKIISTLKQHLSKILYRKWHYVLNCVSG